MCARILMCPLCSQPGFVTLDALRAGLISVATQPLVCPVCNEVLLGIDKLTIHLFSHTINLSNNTIDGSKQAESISDHSNANIIHGAQNNALQEWNVPKIQITDIAKLPSNTDASQQNVHSCKNISHMANKLSTLDSETCSQDHNLPTKDSTNVMFLQEKTDDERRLNIFQKPTEDGIIMLEPEKCTKNIPQTLTLRIDTSYSCSNNPVNILQNVDQTLHKNSESNKHIWIQNARCKQRVLHEAEKSTDISKIEKISNGVVERCNNRQDVESSSATTSINKECDFANFQTFTNITSQNCKAPVEAISNEKNPCRSKENVPSNSIQCQDENVNHKKILPNLRAFNILAAKEKTERCNICGFYFPNHDILILHKQLVHIIDEKNLTNVPENFLKHYSCHLCSKVFKMRGSLMVHMRVAHIGYNLGTLVKDGHEEPIFTENGYNCPTCGKKFKKEQHVIQHLKTHEAKQWECDVCSKMFTTKYFLKKHKRLHSGEMPYKCNICNKTFTFQQSYHKHRLYHKDDKPHTCVTCGRSFKELSTLHNHERIHTGEKPFACETCGKCFRQRVSYLVHRRIHTGIMPYKCTTCGKSFRYKVSQRTHKCPVQQTTYVQESNNADQRSEQMPNMRHPNNESLDVEKTNFTQEQQTVGNVLGNEDNKYILIINNEGQHLFTKESNIRSIPGITDKEQSTENAEINNENKEVKSVWSSNISSNASIKKLERNDKIFFPNEKPTLSNANDFFSMVMSPLENELCSPTAEMEHLRVSSPQQKGDLIEQYNSFRNNSNDIGMDTADTNTEQRYCDNNDTNSLQTINEESLKQLLYGLQDK